MHIQVNSKVVGAILISALILLCASCQSRIERDIRGFIGKEIKNLTIKKLPVHEKYYSYTHEYTVTQAVYKEVFIKRTTEQHLMNEANRLAGVNETVIHDKKQQLQDYFANKNNKRTHYIEWYESSIADDEAKLLEYKEDARGHKTFVDVLLPFEDSLKTELKRMELEQTGSIYVAKFKIKDKYSQWSNDFAYAVFAYDSDNTIHQFKEDGYLAPILSAFPEAKYSDLK